MIKDLRITVGSFIVSLILIRLWIEIVTMTILKNSNLLNQINNNQVGFHHWQMGLLFILLALLAIWNFPKWKNQTILFVGLGLALLVDQYIYVLRMIGVNLPFEYRSQTDYLIIGLFTVGLILYWKFLLKKNEV